MGTIQAVKGLNQTQAARITTRNLAARTSNVVVHHSAPAPDGAGATGMNPERARMLSAAPRGQDPHSDLYEPPRPKRSASTTKTGTNDVPLGKPRVGRDSSIDQGQGAPQKRKPEEALQLGIAKRPRVDVGRASELVQATLQGKPKHTSSESTYGRLQPVSEDVSWQARFDDLLKRSRTASTAGSAPEQAPTVGAGLSGGVPVKTERWERF